MTQELYDFTFIQPRRFNVDTQSFLRPVGIDKVHAETILNIDRRYAKLDILSSTQWKESQNLKTKSYYYRFNSGDEATRRVFRWCIYWRLNREKGTNQSEKCWVLSVQFNPSYWMPQLGVAGASQGFNYVAGNAEALELALADMEKSFALPEFLQLKSRNTELLEEGSTVETTAQLIGVRLSNERFLLNRVDLTRDIHFRPNSDSPASSLTSSLEKEEEEEEASLSFMQSFLGSSPAYVNRFDPRNTTQFFLNKSRLRYLKKLLKQPGQRRIPESEIEEEVEELELQKASFYNLDCVPYDYLSCQVGARRGVFYVKRRFEKIKGHDKKSLVGAPVRFELRLIRRNEISDVLKTEGFEGLQSLLEASDNWNEGGSVGPEPSLEAAVDDYIISWAKPPSSPLKHAERAIEKGETQIEVVPPKDCSDPDLQRFLLRLEKEQQRLQNAIFRAAGAVEAVEYNNEAFKVVRKQIKENIKLGAYPQRHLPIYSLEDCLLVMRLALIQLGPLRFYQIAAVTSGHLIAGDKSKPVAANRMRYSRLVGLTEYILFLYDRDFLQKKLTALRCCLKYDAV